MKKIITNSLLVLGTITLPQLSSGNASPHWTANNIDCIDCHQNHMGPKTACEFCHSNDTGANFSKTSAPEVLTHSSAVIGSNKYGSWEKQCVDCHDPHVSAQCDTPLVSGSFTSYSAGPGTTTFILDSTTVHDSNWQNPIDWNAKTGPERGLIFLVEGMLWDAAENSYIDFSSEIVSATATTITVQGEITEISTVRDFKILYGQYIKPIIDTLPVSFNSSPVGLAFNEAAPANDPTPDGICQVCHTQTKYWRNDGSMAVHFNGEDCTTCHEHELGFRPSCNACHGYPPVVDTPGQINGLVWTPAATGATGAGAHELHAVDNGIPCESCHDSGMPVTPIVDDYKLQMGFNIAGQPTTGNSYDGQSLNPVYSYEGTNGTNVTTGGTMSCVVYCHSDGTSVSTGALGSQPSPSWVTGSTDCSTCHSYPPAYAQDVPKSNSHQRHIQAGFSCEACHYGTTTDGINIVSSGNHGNGQYDIIGAPTFHANSQDHQLDLVYIFDAGGGSCSVNSCHGYFGFNTPIRWGNVYLRASPSITFGDESNEIDFRVTVTDCGLTSTCYTPFTCSFDWGDGVSETGSCTASHVYPAAGDYLVTWNVWDTKNHSMENDKINPVTVQEIIADPEVTVGASFDPATGIVTVTVPEATTAGVPVAKVYVFWGDRTRSSISPPIVPIEHTYLVSGTYQIRVVVYDQNYGKMTYTYLEEPSLEVTVTNP